MRTQRSVVGKVMRQLDVGVGKLAFVAPPAGERRTVYDLEHGGTTELPGTKVRGEGDEPSADEAVNEAYDGADQVYDFYNDVLQRDSIDGNGLELVSSVHYGVDFDNAFWNGGQMVYGDGSGQLFVVGGLTKAIDVIGHEMTHGVTQYTAGLEYASQPGALNESVSDVFGSPGQAIQPQPERRRSRLADRRGDPASSPWQSASLDEGTGHGVRRG